MIYFVYGVSVAVGIAALVLYFLWKTTGGKKKSTNMSGTCSAENCGLAAVLQCSKCKFAGYCSKECQKKHWQKHKKECLPCTFSVVVATHPQQGQKVFSTMCVNPNYRGDDRVLLNELDWFVTEKVESAWLFASVNATALDFQRCGIEPVPRDFLDQEICRETILLTIHTRRGNWEEAPAPPKMIEIEGPVTVKGLLKAIHQFYNATFLTETDIQDVENDERRKRCPYGFNGAAIHKYRVQHQPVMWRELISDEGLRLSNPTERREPWDCGLGRIRFEGIQRKLDASVPTFELHLGS